MKIVVTALSGQDDDDGGCQRCYPGSCNYLARDQRAGWCQLHSQSDIPSKNLALLPHPVWLENKDIWTQIDFNTQITQLHSTAV